MPGFRHSLSGPQLATACTMGIVLLLVSACSSKIESRESSSSGACPAPDAELPLGVTPPAPAAICAEPPAPMAALVEAGARQRQQTQAARRTALLDPSRITIVTCGTGSPIPSASAQACTAVFVNGQFLLFDAGDGAQRSMEELDLPVADIDAVFLTHFHSDHVADLGEVMSRSWILGRTEPLLVYGGEAVERVVGGFNAVYALDDNYRVAHHGEEVFPTEGRGEAVRIDTPPAEGKVVYEAAGIRVTAYRVDHSPIEPALGYRVEYGGKAVAISGDSIDTAGLRSLAEGADVLVSEVMNKNAVESFECAFNRLPDTRNATIFRDIRTYHIDVGELAELAETAGVPKLVLIHRVPNIPGQDDLLFRQPVEAAYSGEVVVAEDGIEVSLDIM